MIPGESRVDRNINSRIVLVHLVINEHGPIFFDILDLFTEVLQNLGLTVERTTNRLAAKQLNLLVGHTMFLPPSESRRIAENGRPYIVFQVEALHETEGFLSRHPGYWELLQGASQIWNYSEANVAILKERGLTNVHYIPLGHAQKLERVVFAPERNIDVLFFGTLTPRRRRVLDGLRERGIRAEFHFATYGAARNALISRAKVLLNMHQIRNVAPYEYAGKGVLSHKKISDTWRQWPQIVRIHPQKRRVSRPSAKCKLGNVGAKPSAARLLFTLRLQRNSFASRDLESQGQLPNGFAPAREIQHEILAPR
jgi:hypothetical protein